MKGGSGITSPPPRESEMRYVDDAKLAALTTWLGGRELGDRVISARIDIFLCQKGGEDRKARGKLDALIRDTAAGGAGREEGRKEGVPGSSGTASFVGGGGSTTTLVDGGVGFREIPDISIGDLSDSNVRKTLINLIFTMNESFPDHDFSTISASSFHKGPSVAEVMNNVARDLAEVSDLYDADFQEKLWCAIEEAIKLEDCQVYHYVSDMEGDPFSDGCLWSFNYFFCNQQLNKVLYFVCICKSKFAMDVGDDAVDSDEDDYEGSDNAL